MRADKGIDLTNNPDALLPTHTKSACHTHMHTHTHARARTHTHKHTQIHRHHHRHHPATIDRHSDHHSDRQACGGGTMPASPRAPCPPTSVIVNVPATLSPAFGAARSVDIASRPFACAPCREKNAGEEGVRRRTKRTNEEEDE